MADDGGGGGGGGSLVRTVLVHMAGNRATWEHLGIHGGLWQVNPDRAASIFADGPCCGNNNNNNNLNNLASMMMATDAASPNHNEAAATSLTDRLSRAMIRKVTLLESNTNIEEMVAVQIDGLPPREFTRNGEGASIFLTGEGRVTQPQELFSMSGNTELGMQWMRQFPRYTGENLETEGVMFLTGASYYFVHQEHPVIHFLKVNEEQLGIVCFQEPSLEGGWIRIDVDTFVFTVRSLRETVLRNTPSTFNLNMLTVRVTKPEGQRWLHICPQFINSLLSDEVRESNDPELIKMARQLGAQRYFDRPLFVTLRLSIEYALPDASACATPAMPSAAQLAGANNTVNAMVVTTSGMMGGHHHGVGGAVAGNASTSRSRV